MFHSLRPHLSATVFLCFVLQSIANLALFFSVAARYAFNFSKEMYLPLFPIFVCAILWMLLPIFVHAVSVHCSDFVFRDFFLQLAFRVSLFLSSFESVNLSFIIKLPLHAQHIDAFTKNLHTYE